jgi:uncharacterized membrane-anchored protein YjiN (DUF445 family)
VTAEASTKIRLAYDPSAMGLADLRQMRRVATGLLLVMALIFVASKNWQAVHPAIGFVRAFAEAAMVGGLADWFAVSALFRHPMGIPIPHTAIVPRNKDRIGDTMAAFLYKNFLIPRLIARKMRRVDVAGAIGRFLAHPTGGEGRLRMGASRMIADALGALDQDRLGGLVKAGLADRIRELDVAPLLGQMLAAALKDGRHQPLLDGIVKWGARALHENEDMIHQMVHDNSNGIVRFTGLDEAIAKRIVTGLSNLLGDMAYQTDHPFRLKVEEALARVALDLQIDPEMQARVARVRDEMLADPAVTRWLDGLWEQGRAALMRAARDPETLLAGRIGELLRQLGGSLGDDGRMNKAINRFARRTMVGAANSYGEQALQLVSDTVRSWDASTITDRLERAVGKDLQYIRINGTMVGGLVGLILHAADYFI